MSMPYSSAGLLLLYLKGYEEDGRIFFQNVSNYSFLGEELYTKIMEISQDNDETNIHVFAVVGLNEKANAVFSVICNGIKNNYERICSGQNINTNSCELDYCGNIFFRSVQEFFCVQPNHFPENLCYSYDEISFNGICSNMLGDYGETVADSIVSRWFELESPDLCGQQLMIRSFFMNDFVNRKIISALPDMENNYWRLVIEGGHQLYLRENTPYSKETLPPSDIGAFCSSNIQSILLNPIYAFGKYFQPSDICEEWHKAFLYLCAVSDTEWNEENISRVYNRFLDFLEKNICIVMDAESIISEDVFYRVLISTIYNYRGFLKGEDEPVISKDLHQTLDSRYVYLPYLWPIVDPNVSQPCFNNNTFQELIRQSELETDSFKKGVLWENTAKCFLEGVDGWIITGQRIKTLAQEIDLSVVNASLNYELWKMGAYILVECKNWKSHVNINQIRNIAHIISMKGSTTAILFAANGITADANKEIKRLSSNNINIVCLTMNDLKTINSADDCCAIVTERWNNLQNTFIGETI